MSLTRHSVWLLLVATVACLLLTSAAAWAQDDPIQGNEFEFAVNYFSNATTATKGVNPIQRIVNTGSYAPDYPPSTLCAMIYVFDDKQEMESCCSCQISTNGIAQLGLLTDLVPNPINGHVPSDGDIKILSALPNVYPTPGVPPYPNGVWGYQPTSGPFVAALNSCDPSGGGFTPSGGYYLNITPQRGLVAWGVHLPGYKTSDGQLTEAPFIANDLSYYEQISLQEQCAGIIQEGSGKGLCYGESQNSNSVCAFPEP